VAFAKVLWSLVGATMIVVINAWRRGTIASISLSKKKTKETDASEEAVAESKTSETTETSEADDIKEQKRKMRVYNHFYALK